MEKIFIISNKIIQSHGEKFCSYILTLLNLATIIMIAIDKDYIRLILYCIIWILFELFKGFIKLTRKNLQPNT